MPYWCCAQLVPQRERLAIYTLGLAGYTTYLPRLRVSTRSYGRSTVTTPALFPGYAFILIELQWHTARWSPGVARLVMDGLTPAVVPDGVIGALRARERGGLIDLPRPPKFRAGDKVRVLHGPFIGHIGLYAGMKARQRIEVLLAILGGSSRVTLPKDAVEAVR